MHVHNILASLRKHEEANSGLEKKTLAHWQSIRNKQATEVKLADYLRLPCEIDVALARHIVERGECFFQGEMVTPCEMGDGLPPHNVALIQSSIAECYTVEGYALHITLKTFGNRTFFLGQLPRFICHI